METTNNLESNNHKLAVPSVKIIRCYHEINGRNCVCYLDDDCMDDDV